MEKSVSSSDKPTARTPEPHRFWRLSLLLGGIGVLAVIAYFLSIPTAAQLRADEVMNPWQKEMQNDFKPTLPKVHRDELSGAFTAYDANSASDRERQIREWLLQSKAMEPYKNKPFKSEPQPPRLVTGEGEIWIDRAAKVTHTRSIDQVISLTDVPGLHLGQVIDAITFQKVGTLNDFSPSLKLKPRTVALNGYWPTADGKKVKVAQVMNYADSAGYHQALNDLLGDRFKTGPVKLPLMLDYRFEEASSNEQIESELNISGKYSGPIFSASASYNNHQASESSRRMIYLYARQPFFTAVLPQTALADFIADDMNLSILNDVRTTKRPGVVTGIVYGRVVFAAMLTSSDSHLVKEAANAEFKGWGAEVTIEDRKRAEKALSQTTMRFVIHGGSSDAQVIEVNAVEGLKKLKEYLNRTIEFGPNNLGAVIGFEVRDMLTGDLVGIQELSEYTAFEAPKRQPYRYRLTLVEANISNVQDDHFFSGEDEWCAKVFATRDDKEGEVLHFYRLMSKKSYTIMQRSSPDPLKASAEVSLKFLIGEEDDDKYIVSAAKMREGSGTGAIDDFKEHPETIDLKELAIAASKNSESTKRPITLVNGKFVYDDSVPGTKFVDVVTEQGNTFKFLIEVLPPTVPKLEEAAK